MLKETAIEAGQQISAVLGAANRDPGQFPHPNRFDVTRTPNRHLGFGLGIHFCLGAALARSEAQIGFTRLLSALPDLALVSETPQWNGNTDFSRIEDTARRLLIDRTLKHGAVFCPQDSWPQAFLTDKEFRWYISVKRECRMFNWFVYEFEARSAYSATLPAR